MIALHLGFSVWIAAAAQRTGEPISKEDSSAKAAVGRLPADLEIQVTLTLPLRNRAALRQLLVDQANSSGTRYHQYLTPDEFTQRFGPTPDDYAAVAAFATTQHLKIVQRHPNRTVMDVSGTVADIERAFQVRLKTYLHPMEDRMYFAPDRLPIPVQPIPLLQVSGLENASLPRPAGIRLNPLPRIGPRPTSRPVPQATGSDSTGLYIGSDFRSAYVPGTVLTGTGESVALVEFDGYYPMDISSYLKRASLSAVSLTNIYLNGVSGVPGINNSEVALDICLTQCMAPALNKILVYQGTNPITVLNKIATDNAARQICCSWLWSQTNGTAALDQVLSQFAAQGQSFFSAAGDTGAYTTGTPSPTDSPLATSVGGTTLTVLTPGGIWFSEEVWSWQPTYFVGSGGGVSSNYTIPNWQSSVSMGINGGSTQNRNIPDVTLVANNILTFANNGTPYGVVGTSAAAPLWAGFCALVNQQSISGGKSPVGRLNPALYALGRGTNYSLAFHDVTIGNNTNQNSGETRYLATNGYDLCSGWGSPNGMGLINLLSPPVAPVITSSSNSVVGFSGRSITLTFSAIGSPLLSYQWRLNGAPIAGATSTQLVLNNLGLESAGVYSISVTNSYGTTTSVVASLQVIEGVDAPLWSPWHVVLFGSGLFVLARRTLTKGLFRGQTG
jgi:subtilase family serine protease